MNRIDKQVKIVELACLGCEAKYAQFELNIPEYEYKSLFESVRREALLPRYKKDYPQNKSKIMKNVEKWKKHKERKSELHKKYINSLTKFI